MEDDPKQAQEIWEATTGGTTFINVRDPRNPRAWIQKSVGGKGTQRITLTIEEREFNQDAVVYESQHLDPFTNGMLYRISPKQGERGQYEVTDEQLVALLQGGSDEEYEQLIENTKSEVVLRRLLFLSDRNATAYRARLLAELVDRRYHVGKTSKVVQEMYDDESKYQGADL